MEYVVNGKTYATLMEAEAAEKQFELAQAQKKTLAETKKARATEIETAFKEFRATEVEENKKYKNKVDEAKKIYQDTVTKAKDDLVAATKEKQDKYIELKNAFIKDYGSYHMSSYTVNDDTEVKVSNLINNIFDSIFWF